MLTRNIAYYEMRIAFGWTALLPALGLPVFALLAALTWASREQSPHFSEIKRAFELILPAATGLASAHLMSLEREENFDELRRSYGEASWRLPLLRILGASAVALASVLLALMIFRLGYGPFDLFDAVLPAVPPAMALMGLAMLVNNVAGNYWVAAGTVVAWCWLDAQTHGEHTRLFYLFQDTWPHQDIDFALNRGALIALALVLWGANAAYSTWRRRR